MKVLAHPIRQRILSELQRGGEVTSTTLAHKLGVTTGNTSYNLRVLAEHGFVEEVPGRGNGRERWWRGSVQDLRFPRHSEQGEAMRAVFQEFNNLALAEDEEALHRFLRRRDELGPWADALPFSRGTVNVTLGQLEEFFEEYIALLMKYADSTNAPDARSVRAYFLAFPEVPSD
ncbi:helix-turn-helix domain-containing protein [Kribbella albertanoniae]